MKRVDDFRLKFGKKEYVPIMIGGMGVDISTAELAPACSAPMYFPNRAAFNFKSSIKS